MDRTIRKQIIKRAEYLINEQGMVGVIYLLTDEKEFPEAEKSLDKRNTAFGIAGIMVSTGHYRIYEGNSHNLDEIWVIKEPNYKIQRNQMIINALLLIATTQPIWERLFKWVYVALFQK